MTQSASSVLMISPDYFGYNAETAASNTFQKNDENSDKKEITEKAIQEFHGLSDAIKNVGIQVIIEKDTPDPLTPDAVFPNNWVMFHHQGDVSIFPMAAKSRRQERRKDLIRRISDKYSLRHIYDYSPYEEKNIFLEGTGSIVSDHEHKVAYGCLSPRTHSGLFKKFCKDHGYEAVSFNALNEEKREIYHTNVMMCIGSKISVICAESIASDKEREYVLSRLSATREIMEISMEQMNRFAGNMLQLKNTRGEEFMIMSSGARDSLTAEQIATLEKHTRIIHSSLTTIENYGGGSARCMIAEIFAPPL